MAGERRRGRRPGVVLLLVLGVLALLGVAADRVAHGMAEDRVAAQLQSQLGTAAAPKVDIEGFPFLTQAARRSFSSVRVRADDLRPAGSSTPVKHVDLRLRDVTSNDNFQTSTARQVTGTATLDYPTVKKLTRQPLSYAPEGKVQVSAPTTVMGLSVTALVVGRPEVNQADQTMSLAEAQLTVDGLPVPESASQAVLDSVVKPAPITGVPFGLKLTSVAAQPEGLVAGVTGENVAFRR